MAKRKKPASYLAQLRSPLMFFGLALILTESSFGMCLFRGSYSERTITILASWMGALFIVAMIAVGFLTYKVPRHIMLEFQTTAAEDIAVKTKRIREAVTKVVEFSESGTRDLRSLMAMLGQIELILEGESTPSSGDTPGHRLIGQGG